MRWGLKSWAQTRPSPRPAAEAAPCPPVGRHLACSAARSLYPPPCAVASCPSSSASSAQASAYWELGQSRCGRPRPPQAMAGSGCRPDGGLAGSEVSKGSGDRLVSWPEAPLQPQRWVARGLSEPLGASGRGRHTFQPSSGPGCSDFRALSGPWQPHAGQGPKLPWTGPHPLVHPAQGGAGGQGAG